LHAATFAAEPRMDSVESAAGGTSTLNSFFVAATFAAKPRTVSAAGCSAFLAASS